MKFKSNAIPTPSEGVGYDPKEDQVVPVQGLTIKEILERFTRGEAVHVGQSTWYDESIEEDKESIDYEKIKGLDLTEIDELKAKLTEQVNEYRKTLKPKGKKVKSADDNLDNNMRTDTEEIKN